MTDDTIIALHPPGETDDPPTAVLRDGFWPWLSTPPDHPVTRFRGPSE